MTSLYYFSLGRCLVAHYAFHHSAVELAAWLIDNKGGVPIATFDSPCEEHPGGQASCLLDIEMDDAMWEHLSSLPWEIVRPTMGPGIVSSIRKEGA